MDIYAMSDKAILEEIGDRLLNRRLKKNISQEELASRAGINRATVRQIERGGSCSLLTLIELLRVLDCLEDLEHFLPPQQFSPLQAAKMKDKQRLRASGSRKNKDKSEDSSWPNE
jgi:transcriptional regulator with XRE-family HTH domain